MTSLRAWAATPGRSILRSTRIDGPILLDIAALLAFPIVRILNDNTLIGAWAVSVLILAIRWPGSGLGLAAALAVFPQPVRIGFAPSVALIAASSVGFAIDLALRGQPDGTMRRRLAIVVAGVIALAAATLVALLRSELRLGPSNAVQAARHWVEFGAGLAFFVMLLRAFSLGSRRALLLGLIGITTALAVSLVEFLAPRRLASIGMRWLVPEGDTTRAIGPFVSPNRLATVAGIVAVVGASQTLMTDRWRWAWAGLTALSGVALIASFSRGALLGLVVAGAAILAIRSRRAAVVYIAVVALAAVVAVPLYVGARLAGAGTTLDELLLNDQGRLDAWVAGIRMIVAEPIFGHGFFAFGQLGESFGATDGLQTAHNEFIGFWAEGGIVAFAAYVVTAAGIVACALERRADSWAMIAIGALAVFLVATSFNLHSIYLSVTAPLWLLVAYGIGRPLGSASLEPAPLRRPV